MRLGAFLPAALALLAAQAPTQAPLHSLMLVNDPRSHGVVGDGFLSLNECIRLHNLTLQYSELSPAEQAQITINGDFLFARIDATVVPVITCERDLDEILPSQFGMSIHNFRGMPVLDLAGTRGLVVSDDFFDVHGLRFRNAATALNVVQTGPFSQVVVDGCWFDGMTATGAALRYDGAGGNSFVRIADCQFTHLATALRIDAPGADRYDAFALYDVDMHGAALALGCDLGPGGQCSWLLDRVELADVGDGVRVRRVGSGAGRELTLESHHLRVEAAHHACEVWGDPTSLTAARLWAADLTGAGTAGALWLGPWTSAFDASVEDSWLVGSVCVGAASGPGVVLRNDWLQGGVLALGNHGAPCVVSDAVLEPLGCVSLGPLPAVIERSCVRGGWAAGQPGAPLRIASSHLAGVQLLTAVETIALLTQPPLGRFAVTPTTAAPGAALQLGFDLPAGTQGVCTLGPTAQYPLLGSPPFHLYAEPTGLAVLPLLVRGQAQVRLDLPNDPALRGSDAVFQAVVLADPGVPAPPVWLPPPRRVRVR